MAEDWEPEDIGCSVDIAISVINGAIIVRRQSRDGMHFHGFSKASTASLFVKRTIEALDRQAAEYDEAERTEDTEVED